MVRELPSSLASPSSPSRQVDSVILASGTPKRVNPKRVNPKFGFTLFGFTLLGVSDSQRQRHTKSLAIYSNFIDMNVLLLASGFYSDFIAIYNNLY